MLNGLGIFRQLFALLLAGAVLLPITGAWAQQDPLDLYHQGVEAATMGEREQFVEEALTLYMARFNAMKEDGGMNGQLCYNIGNCYFILNQLGEAVYYYRLGLELLPGNEKLQANLAVALEKRGAGVDVEPPGIKATLLFFHYRYPTAVRINLVIFFSIVCSLSLVGYFLRPHTALRYASLLSLVVFCGLVISVGGDYYAPDHVGVAIASTEVRQDAGPNFAAILAAPLSPGSSVVVLDLQGDWFKVKLNDGRKGFVRQEDMKLVAL